MAEQIRQRFGLEVKLEEGGVGEFSVWLEGDRIVKKGWFGFPPDEQILAQLEKRLGQHHP
ncbi:MAG: hypothetical protein HY319_13660 [Armatimonadetes bacterium]|nr:hypothetical protein [Armatimonadota bacterium]